VPQLRVCIARVFAMAHVEVGAPPRATSESHNGSPTSLGLDVLMVDVSTITLRVTVRAHACLEAS